MYLKWEKLKYSTGFLLQHSMEGELPTERMFCWEAVAHGLHRYFSPATWEINMCLVDWVG